MLKITALLSIMFVVSSVWAGCDSCGSECEPVCGTRRFRTCCFNYLRKKRGPDAVKVPTISQNEKETQMKSLPLVYLVEEVSTPEEWTFNALPNKNHPYSLEDVIENRLHEV